MSALTLLAAIDPGYAARGEGCAVAIFVEGVLARAYFARPDKLGEALGDMGMRVGGSAVYWECPQVDTRTRVSVPACVKLAAVGGMLAGMYAGAWGATIRAVSPSEWKGSTAKPVHHARMWRTLHDTERWLLGGAATLQEIESAQRKGALDRWSRPGASYYPARWNTHNLLDAAALGLWAVGR